MSKVIEGNTKVYTFLGLDILYEKDVNASIVNKYFYANGVQIARINPFATTYFHQDALGSTRLTTDGAKLVQFSSNYKPFGPQHGASGTEGQVRWDMDGLLNYAILVPDTATLWTRFLLTPFNSLVDNC